MADVRALTNDEIACRSPDGQTADEDHGNEPWRRAHPAAYARPNHRHSSLRGPRLARGPTAWDRQQMTKMTRIMRERVAESRATSAPSCGVYATSVQTRAL